jgi:hypothetical protein
LSRYSDITYILSLYWETGIGLIIKCNDKNEESKAWQMWLTLYPNMEESNFMAFTEYYEKIRVPMIPKRTKKEIMDDVKRIRAMMPQKG